MTTSQPVSTPMDEDYAVCAACGTELEAVRPGKHQHPGDTRRLCDLLQTRARSLREAVELLAARDKTIETLRLDAERLDWLEAERTDMPGTLFRSNHRITRAAIDAARGEGGKPHE